MDPCRNCDANKVAANELDTTLIHEYLKRKKKWFQRKIISNECLWSKRTNIKYIPIKLCIPTAPCTLKYCLKKIIRIFGCVFDHGKKEGIYHCHTHSLPNDILNFTLYTIEHNTTMDRRRKRIKKNFIQWQRSLEKHCKIKQKDWKDRTKRTHCMCNECWSTDFIFSLFFFHLMEYIGNWRFMI